MPRSLAVHLTAMVVLAGLTAFVLRELGPAVPALNRWVVIGQTVAYLAAWLVLLVLGQRPATPRQAWRRYTRLITWGGFVVVVAGFWLVAPYADPALRLVMVIYQVGTVTIQVAGSVRRPPETGRPGPELMIIPASIALYYLAHWETYSAALIVFALAYGYLALALADVLQRASDRAYAARDAKARFLASASHDLGQPLHAARLYLDQVLRSRTAGARGRAGQKAAWALETTEQLLDRILDHLRLDAGAVEPVLKPAPLGPLIAGVAELNEPAARLAGVELVVLPSGLCALADEALTQRALGNLVGNSLRHAKARRVLVGARRRAGRVRLWVIDDGVGVPAEEADRLFEDYVQGARRPGEVRGGFGLGLASARRIAELMGGSVGLERKWTGGAAFWLELPAASTNSA